MGSEEGLEAGQREGDIGGGAVEMTGGERDVVDESRSALLADMGGGGAGSSVSGGGGGGRGQYGGSDDNDFDKPMQVIFTN